MNSQTEQSVLNVAALPYTKDWTREYLAAAEFELVVQKQLLPVHKHVLSMSPFFQRELFKTESKKSLLSSSSSPQKKNIKKKEDSRNNMRLRLTCPSLQDSSLDDVCLLLSHVYVTEAHLSVKKMDELRKLVVMTENFGFPALTRRCVNFIRNNKGIEAGVERDLEANQAVAATQWMDLAIKWNLPQLKDIICRYIGENFFEIYGDRQDTKLGGEWADLVVTLNANIDLWKRIVRSQAMRIESRPSLVSLISNQPSTTMIYGLVFGILTGSLLPSWMFFMIVVGTGWHVYNRLPLSMIIVIQKTLEGVMKGLLQGGEGKENDPIVSSILKDNRSGAVELKNWRKPMPLGQNNRIAV